MKHIKFIAAALALLMVMTAFAGCSAQSASSSESASESVSEPVSESSGASSSESSSLTFTDMKGREITLDAPAEKVVALTASDCEILYALGAGDTLVGRGEYCDYPDEVTNVPSVQSGSDTNIEQIISLAPQAVIMSTMAQTDEQIASLEDAGIKVIVSDAQNIEGIYTAIELIGKVVGKNDEAAALIEQMKASFSDIESKAKAAAGDTEKTVYFEVSPLQYGLWTAGKNTFMDELCTMLHVKNAFGDVDGWAEISEEQVIERDPDYIVTITMYFGEGEKPVDEIMGRTGWQDMKAIKNSAVLNADSNEISRPGPRLVDAAKTLYDFFYGSNS